ncbi:Nif3-like dinuclear metal center hexameric protein [Lactobacillaceae bacterium L1_55_11]|nr:Nif3-like dinuclear metal center hexameric protein [Lactobacillaceae bacterium L1_55_11]
MVSAQKLIDQIESFAPKDLAEKGDPTGLQIGDPNQDIKRVLTTLDVRPETVDYAIEHQIDFIWAHHEVMFFPAKNLDLSNPQHRLYAKLLKHDIVVYASHTNLDSAENGMNDWLVQAFAIQDPKPLLPGAQPQTGLGRIGYLKKPQKLSDYARFIKQVCGVDQVRVISPDLDREVQTVAVLGGDGGRWWPTAQAAGADVYITADLYYHVGHDVLAADFAVIDPDHHMEALGAKPMAHLVTEWQPELSVEVSPVNTDPYQYL